MSDIYHNNSGCYDPTAGEALAHICHEQNIRMKAERQEDLRSRPFVYICSKYAGNTEVNVWRAVRFCRYAISKGKIPIASHLLYPQILDDRNPAQREMGLQFGLALLGICSEVWVFNENRELSEGMQAEVRFARQTGKPVRFHDIREMTL